MDVLCLPGDGVPKDSSANDNGTTIMYDPVTYIHREVLPKIHLPLAVLEVVSTGLSISPS